MRDGVCLPEFGGRPSLLRGARRVVENTNATPFFPAFIVTDKRGELIGIEFGLDSVFRSLAGDSGVCSKWRFARD
jgi:hypothetical protein